MNTSAPLNRMHHVLGLRLVLFVCLMSLRATSVIGGGIFQPKTHVSIINDIQPDSNLTVHCKSKNDDLGVHDIPHGGKYDIVFYPDFFGRTLYFCGMQWKDSPLKYFDIYKGKRDNSRCLKCKHYDWSIRAGGPCMFNSKTKQFDICDPWNN